MSVKQMARVWDLDLDHAQRLVLLALADHAHDDGGGVRPAVGLVAWKTGYSARSVKRILRVLRDLGLLEVVRQGGGDFASLYRLRLDVGKPKPPYQMWGGVEGQEEEGAILAPVTNTVLDKHENGKDKHENGNRSTVPDTLTITRTINQEPSGSTLAPHHRGVVRAPNGQLQASIDLVASWKHQFPLVDVDGWIAFIGEYAQARPTWAHRRRNWRLTILRWLRTEQERAVSHGLTRPGQDQTLEQRKAELQRWLAS